MALRIKTGAKISVKTSEQEYFYHEALADDYNLIFVDTKNVLEYSLDNCKTWIVLPPNTKSPKIKTGERIYLKGKFMKVDKNDGIGVFGGNRKFKIGGNIMSLVYGDDFIENDTMERGQFQGLFRNNVLLVSASKLVLPTKLTEDCFSYMFHNCNKLEDAPKLLANELKEYCYNCMFFQCKKLNEITMLGENIDIKYALFMFCKECKPSGKIIMKKNISDDAKDMIFPIMKPTDWIIEYIK